MKYFHLNTWFCLSIILLNGITASAQITFVPHTVSGGELSTDGAHCVFSIDLDQDSDIDLLSASYEDNKINWYENKGNQLFTPYTINNNAVRATSVYALDVDNDGDIDVLSASHADNKIAWYENDGNQNFITHIISIEAFGANDVYALDVDNDGDVDVLSASTDDNKIAWYENDGNQDFVTHNIALDAGDAYSVYADDVDGDGDIDVLSSSWDDNRIAWYENDGNQNFITHIVSTNARGASSIYSLDVDNDGDIDILSTSEIDDKVEWYENDGNQNFISLIISDDVDGARSIYALDMEGDGDVDILTASIYDNKIAWYENDGNQDFVTHNIALDAGGAYSVYADDVDGDGDIDVLSASSHDDKIAWYENDGNQNFIARIITSLVHNANSVYAMDIDKDADIDILSASNFDNGVKWYENNGNQNFTPKNITTNSARAWSVISLDIDNDFDIDVLSASYEDNMIAWYENDGNQNFTTHLISIDAYGVRSVYAVDIDNDIDIDILSAFKDVNEIIFYENDGNQNFMPRTISTNANGVESVYALDIDGDNDIDALSGGGNRIIWYENDGNQIFTPYTLSITAQNIISIFAIDIDGDNDIDVLSASMDDFKIAWYENDGNQNFTSHVITVLAIDAYSVYAIDLDEDDDIDVLSASNGDSKISWYENDGNQNFASHVITINAYGARSVFAIDVDSDGDIDVLSASEDDNKIAWYENLGNLTPSITLMSPNGGEKWQVGTQQDITWNSTGVSNVKIEYSTNGGQTWIDPPIAESYPASNQSYDWAVPEISSNNCVIRISDASDPNTNDVSDEPFSILKPGTSVIVHGYASLLNSDQLWAWTMAQAIAERLGNGQVYTLRNGIINHEATYSVGIGGENILVFDWLEESNIGVLGFSEGAGDALASLLIKGERNGYWNLENLHFIAFSRGTVVTNECIQRLDAWTSNLGMLPADLEIDTEIHFTAIDAHPWDGVFGDYIGDPGNAHDHSVNDLVNPTLVFGKSIDGVVCWKNVKFADNYWHTGSLSDLSGMQDFKGCEDNLDLTAVGITHGGMHAWYHGTINRDAVHDGDGEDINRNTWYPNYEDSLKGYNYSKTVLGPVTDIQTTPQGEQGGVVSWEEDKTFHKDQIFNGNFDFTRPIFVGSNNPPGWDLHGGGGSGLIFSSNDDGGMNKHLVLNLERRSRTHNFFYIPNDTERIHFMYRVVNKSSNDELVVTVGTEEKRLSLASKGDSYIREFIDVSSLQGTVQTLKFRIDPNGLLVTSAVWIDAVSFRLEKYISVIVASPVSLHAYDVSGNHTGPTSDTTFVTEIPGSRYLAESDTLEHPRQMIILPEAVVGNEYLINIISNNTFGSFDLEIQDVTGDIQTTTIAFDSVLVEPSTVATCTLHSVHEITDLTMLEIDVDGDGSYEDTLLADLYLESFRITPIVQGNGTIFPTDTNFVNLDTILVNYADSLTFNIVPDSGYQIQDVLIDSISVGTINSFTFNNIINDHIIAAIFSPITSISQGNQIPRVYELEQNYPNPFNPLTTIKYSLPEPGTVTITIFNQLGQKVRILLNERQFAGRFQIEWDGKNDMGELLSSGIYYYQLRTEKFTKANKMLLLK